MGEEFYVALSFRDYCQLNKNDKCKGERGLGAQNFELQHTIGRMYHPTFDGPSTCTSRTWVEKLDTYF